MKKLILLIAFISLVSFEYAQTDMHTMPPDSVVLKFLNWYKINFKKSDTFYFVSDKNDSSHIINGRWGDSTIFYSVNFKGTEKFLKFLNSSNCLSNKYIENKRVSFKERSIKLDKQKQWDYPPYGFSADEVFFSNMIESLVPSLEKAKIETINSDKNFIKLKFNTSDYPAVFSLSKYDNKWLIDDIK
jgi:hypothetical protein